MRRVPDHPPQITSRCVLNSLLAISGGPEGFVGTLTYLETGKWPGLFTDHGPGDPGPMEPRFE